MLVALTGPMLLSGTGIDLVAGHDGQAGVDGREAELEGQRLLAAAGVVDVDLVQRIRVHGVVVRDRPAGSSNGW